MHTTQIPPSCSGSSAMAAAALSPRVPGKRQPVEVMRCRGGLRRWRPWRRRSHRASWWLSEAKGFSAQAQIAPSPTVASQAHQALRSGPHAKAWTLCATTSRATWMSLCTTRVPSCGGQTAYTKPHPIMRTRTSTQSSSCSTSGYLHTRPHGSASQSYWSRSPRRLRQLPMPTTFRPGPYDSKAS